MILFIYQTIGKEENMHTSVKKSFTEHLSNPKMMSLFIISMVIIGFFFANFLLHFLQQVLFLVDDFATNPEEVNFHNFSVDWHHFFIFQKKWIGFYVGFYIVIGISVVKLLYNIKMNYQDRKSTRLNSSHVAISYA